MTITSANLTGGAEHQVWVRRAPADGSVPALGGDAGWVYVPNLRCNRWHAQTGADPGYAEFELVIDGPLDNSPIEDQLASYGGDDQVRVFQYPIVAEFLDETADRNPLVFEGVLSRRRFTVASEPSSDGTTTEREQLVLVAQAVPILDDRDIVHTIRGRWIKVGEALLSTETPDLPAVFNHRGRPNRSGTVTMTAAALGLTCDTFTHDQDAYGEPWRLYHAMRSLLASQLVGVGVALPRSVTIDPQLLDVLALDPEGEGFEGYPPQYAGLDAVLPEVSVQGLGVLSAMERVCEAAGFRFACSPPLLFGATSGGSFDRSYILHAWAHNRGPINNLRLPKRTAVSDDAEVVLRDQANVSRLNGMYDAAPIINAVLATGRTYIECSAVLAPLWSPDDVTDTDPLAATPHQQPPSDKGDWDQYLDRHVVGGADFGLYAHVGRAWGLDCTGESSSQFYPAEDSLYHHPPEGFDWAALTGSAEPINAARAAAGIGLPIFWTHRVRTPQPLTRPELAAAGVQFLLHCSEDGGSTWHDVTGLVGFETLREFFGIRLRLPNLALISVATLGTDTPPAPEDSWWQKIIDKQLLIELTCNVPADFAAIASAPRQPTSSSRYRRGALLQTDVAEVWAHPSSLANPTGQWQQMRSYGNVSVPANTNADLLAMAQQQRDAGEGHRVTASAYAWLMEVGRFRLGDRVAGVTGRDIPFVVRAGDQTRAPSIDAISCTLGPTVAEQGIAVSLGDQALTPPGNKSRGNRREGRRS